MSEFDDVNRYLESMYRVFYALLRVADEASGREPVQKYMPFDQDPGLFFADAYHAAPTREGTTMADTASESTDSTEQQEFLHGIECLIGREVTSIEAL